MAITFNAYATKNQCFKTARKMPAGSPAGIIVHSTGANNPNLKRYVNSPEICGENIYKNYFDRSNIEQLCHAIIGKDKDGIVRAAKLLQWDICCWNCGRGYKGSYNFNPAYIQFEICEDDLTDKQYFDEAFTLAAKLCARLMKNYPTIKLENIISHKEACKRGYASNHVDPENWMSKFGYDMNWFRKLVENKGEIIEKYSITGRKIVEKSEINKTSGKLKALGFDVETVKV